MSEYKDKYEQLLKKYEVLDKLCKETMEENHNLIRKVDSLEK